MGYSKVVLLEGGESTVHAIKGLNVGTALYFSADMQPADLSEYVI